MRNEHGHRRVEQSLFVLAPEAGIPINQLTTVTPAMYCLSRTGVDVRQYAVMRFIAFECISPHKEVRRQTCDQWKWCAVR